MIIRAELYISFKTLYASKINLKSVICCIGEQCRCFRTHVRESYFAAVSFGNRVEEYLCIKK